MRASLLLALLIALVPAQADVYRWVDDSGRVHYGDRPVVGAQTVPLPAPLPAETAPPVETAPDPSGDPGPYTAFEILAPEPNATVRDAQGRVPVALLLDPPLLEGHRMQILLNEQLVPGDMPGMHLALDGLPLGSHRLRIDIVDEFGVTQASTPTIDFHLRRPVAETASP
ncbi:MAG: DUF4124 domain-containing protein [Chromatiaceae bacterium]|jgi:hypothetical protein|nr:DUF4124 domain-containing protein [Chromatiaceae bacterium]